MQGNGVDSNDSQDNDFTPFLNIINEWYAKDTSKKIRAVFKAKGQSGKPLCTNPPYGYLKDPQNKDHWIIDKVAAKIIRQIYKMCMDGFGPTQISRKLEQDCIESPTAHLNNIGINTPAKQPENADCGSSLCFMRSVQSRIGKGCLYRQYQNRSRC